MLFSFAKNKPSKLHIYYPHYHISCLFFTAHPIPTRSLFFLIFVRLTITFVSFPLSSFSVTSTTSWSGLILPLLGPQDKDSHLEFITQAANLRAGNYGISPVDKFQAKRIAGRIVPAIATTTAAVAGLTCLELYKLVWQHKDLRSYRQGFLQLSDPFLGRSQPVPSPQAYKCQQKTWSCWDRITVPGLNSKGEVVTLRDICDHIQREHDLVPQRLLFGTATLYNKEDEIEEQQPPFSLTELIRTITGKSVPKECRLLVLSMVCENEELDDELPPVHIVLQPTSSPK